MTAIPAQIHPTAMVSASAVLGNNVQIGPYVIIEEEVTVGDNCTVGPHSIIRPYTKIGANNRIHAHVILGDIPQHNAFKMGDITWLEIGDNNDIREMATIHRALKEGDATRIGSNNLLMVNIHIGHDCIVGDNVIFTNNLAMAGHVEVGDFTVIGGVVGVHQFVRLGGYNMIAACSMVRKDILPYTLAGGADGAMHYRLNSIGLRRNGIKGEDYRALERAYRALRDGNKQLDIVNTKETQFLQQWLSAPSMRGVAGFHRGKVDID